MLAKTPNATSEASRKHKYVTKYLMPLLVIIVMMLAFMSYLDASRGAAYRLEANGTTIFLNMSKTNTTVTLKPTKIVPAGKTSATVQKTIIKYIPTTVTVTKEVSALVYTYATTIVVPVGTFTTFSTEISYPIAVTTVKPEWVIHERAPTAIILAVAGLIILFIGVMMPKYRRDEAYV